MATRINNINDHLYLANFNIQLSQDKNLVSGTRREYANEASKIYEEVGVEASLRKEISNIDEFPNCKHPLDLAALCYEKAGELREYEETCPSNAEEQTISEKRSQRNRLKNEIKQLEKDASIQSIIVAGYKQIHEGTKESEQQQKPLKMQIAELFHKKKPVLLSVETEKTLMKLIEKKQELKEKLVEKQNAVTMLEKEIFDLSSKNEHQQPLDCSPTPSTLEESEKKKIRALFEKSLDYTNQVITQTRKENPNSSDLEDLDTRINNLKNKISRY